jgi:cytochrome c oxidase subunit IV
MEYPNHITNYKTYAKTLVALLTLTILNILIAKYKPVSWTSGLIIIVAMIQAVIALYWFMHLKFDSRLLKILVTFIFLLYAVVIIITFFDYEFR